MKYLSNAAGCSSAQRGRRDTKGGILWEGHASLIRRMPSAEAAAVGNSAKKAMRKQVSGKWGG